MPAISNAIIPPNATLLYQSSDVAIALSDTGPEGGRSLVSPGSEQMQFLAYDTALIVNGLAFASIVPSGPLIGDTQFTVPPGSSAVFDIVSPSWFTFAGSARWSAGAPAPPAALYITTTAAGGVPVFVTQLGPANGLVVGFNDPAVGSASLAFG